MKIHVYNDPGHGWGAVKRTLLESLGIADQVSSYSYQRGKTVYLEEDCDLSLLIRAFKERGITPEWIDHHTDRRSPIRSYDRYQYN
jgi:hypothetical protein